VERVRMIRRLEEAAEAREMYQTLTVLRGKVTEQEQEINCQTRVKRST
jgi:hypothetical protein